MFCSKLNSFLDFSQTVNLSQYNNILNFNNRLLDFVLSNTDFKISVNLDQQSFVPPDPHHPALHIETEFLISSKLPRFPCDNNRRYNFRKANYNKLYSDLLHTDWSFLTNFEDANVALDHFYTKLYSILESSVPKFLPSKSSYPMWYNRQIISVLKLKNFYWKKWKKTSNMTFYNEFKRLRSTSKQIIKTAYREYLNQIEESMKNNPKDFWKYVHLQKGTTRIPGRLVDEDKQFEDPQEIVNAFAKRFSDVFRPKTIIGISDVISNKLSFTIPSVTEEQLIDIMSTFSNKMTAGTTKYQVF